MKHVWYRHKNAERVIYIFGFGLYHSHNLGFVLIWPGRFSVKRREIQPITPIKYYLDRFSDTETEILGNIDRRTGKYPELEELFYGDGPRAYFYDALWKRVRGIRKAERLRSAPQPVQRPPAQANEATESTFYGDQFKEAKEDATRRMGEVGASLAWNGLDRSSEVYNPAEEAYIARMIDRGDM